MVPDACSHTENAAWTLQVATGQFCRLADLSTLPSPRARSKALQPDTRRTRQVTTFGMVCDQPTMSTASSFLYTGSGLAFNNTPLVVSSGPGQLLVLSTTVNTGPGTGPSLLAFPPAPLGKALEPAAHLGMRCLPGQG